VGFIFDDAIAMTASGMTASGAAAASADNAKFDAMVHAGWDIRGDERN